VRCTVAYRGSRRTGRTVFRGSFRIVRGHGGAVPLLRLVRVRPGRARGGAQFQIIVANGNRRGSAPVIVSLTATTIVP
jgi:hypothetical protein